MASKKVGLNAFLAAVMLALGLLSGCTAPGAQASATPTAAPPSYAALVQQVFAGGVTVSDNDRGNERRPTETQTQALRHLLDGWSPADYPLPLPTPAAGFAWFIRNAQDSAVMLVVQEERLSVTDGQGVHWFTLTQQQAQALDERMAALVPGAPR